MPLDDEYAEGLKTNFADVANVAGRPAAPSRRPSSCSASRQVPWAHLDIAGTAWKGGAAKGSTGRPVGLLHAAHATPIRSHADHGARGSRGACQRASTGRTGASTQLRRPRRPGERHGVAARGAVVASRNRQSRRAASAPRSAARRPVAGRAFERHGVSCGAASTRCHGPAFAPRNRDRFARFGDRGNGRRTLGKHRVYASFRRINPRLNCAAGRNGVRVPRVCGAKLARSARPDHTTGFLFSLSKFWRFSCN
jgi:hypothetical protein